MQEVGIEAIGQGLRPGEVGDANKGVVGSSEVDPLTRQAAGQPAVAVAVHLQPKRAVGSAPAA